MRILCIGLALALAPWTVAAEELGEQAFVEVANQIATAMNELDMESFRSAMADSYFEKSLAEEGKTADQWANDWNRGLQQLLDLMGKIEKIELAELDPPDGAFFTFQHEKGTTEMFIVLDANHEITELNLRPVEHPEGEEHPEEGEEHSEEGEEHPEEGEEHAEEGEEHPEEGEEHPTEKEPPTVESVARFLEDEVTNNADHGGWMTIWDDEANAELKLQLDKIHRERLSKTAEATYFVCADFTTPEGKTYDLDFWVRETEEGLQVTETTIHKEEGQPRYNWVEENGIWKRKSR